MSFASISYPQDKAGRYHLLLEQIHALTDGISHPIANLSNTAALLWQGMPDINWCGFYLMDDGALMETEQETVSVKVRVLSCPSVRCASFSARRAVSSSL